MQRKIESDSSWSWVYGTNGSIVTLTINSSDATSATEPFVNLPKTDSNGNEYSYRVVEVVPNNYTASDGVGTSGSVTYLNADGTEAASDTTTNLVVVSSTNSSQSFTNTLGLTSLSGTKNWASTSTDTGSTSLVPSGTSSIKMKLYRTTATNPGDDDWEEVKPYTSDGTESDPQPSWETGDSWKFNYSNLPATDSNGNAYTSTRQKKSLAL